VEAMKARPPFSCSVLDAVQVGVQGIREVASAAISIERIGSTAEDLPGLGHEALPARRVSGREPACEFEVRRVRRVHVTPTLS
jgi:hypothetical protein